MASRSLGTLTLDLIARTGGFVAGMTEAERSSDKWRKKVEQNAKAVGTAIGVGLTAAVGALTALTVNTVRAADEVVRLSAVAGTSTTEFQRYSAGAKLLGIEQEKLADIFKDVNDKIGDFMQTGAGPMADFFENIAPKVGVTADQFRKLSGPDALGLYVDSLEKAGVSQNEMTFYMEAIASDATMLVPLLKNNAEGFRLLGDRAERAGAIMDEDMLDSAQELNIAMHLFGQSLTGLKNQIAGPLITSLADLSSGFGDVLEDGISAKVISDDIASAFTGIAKAGIGAVGAISLVVKGVKGLGDLASAAGEGVSWTDFLVSPINAVYKASGNLDQVKESASGVLSVLDETAQTYASLIKSMGGESDGQTETAIQKIAKLRKEWNELMQSPGASPDGNAKDKQATEKYAESIQKLIDKYEDQVRALTLTKRQLAEYEAASVAANEADKQRILVAFDQAEAYENAAKSVEAYLEAEAKRSQANSEIKISIDALMRERDALMQGEDAHKAVIRQLAIEEQMRRAIADGIIDEQDPAYRQLLETQYDLQQQITELTGQSDPFAESWQAALERIDNAFVDLWKSAFDGFKDFSDALKNAFLQLLAELAHRATTQQILFSLGLDDKSVGGGSVGSLGDLMSLSGISKLLGSKPLEGLGATLKEWGWTGAGNRIGNLSLMDIGLSAMAGYAGSYLGSNVAESLFGKSAESSWGAMAGGLVGSLWGPLGAGIGSAIGSMIDVAFGGDGNVRSALGVSTNAAWSGEYTREAASGLMLTAYQKRAGEGAAEAAVQLQELFLVTDAALTDFFESLGVTVDLAGQTLAGKASQFGEAADGFFGAAGFNGFDPADIAGAADDFVRAWVDKVNEISGAGIDLEPIYALQREGELLADILIRVHTQFGPVNAALELLNQTAYELGAAGMAAADGLVQLFGGLENFSAATNFYYQEFFSQEERLAATTAQLVEVFNGLNLAMPTTHAEFRAIIEGLDLTSEAGRNMFAVLMQVAPAFDQVADAALAAQQAMIANAASSVTGFLSDYNSILSDRTKLEGQLSAINEKIADQIASMSEVSQPLDSAASAITDITGSVDDLIYSSSQLRGWAQSIMGTVNSLMLGSESPLTHLERFLYAQQQFAAEQVRFEQTGDASGLGSAAQAYLQANTMFNASSPAGVAIFNEVVGYLRDVGVGLESEAEKAERWEIERQRQQELQARISEEIRAATQEADKAAREAAALAREQSKLDALIQERQAIELALQTSYAIDADAILRDQLNELIGVSDGLSSIASLLAILPRELAGELETILAASSAVAVPGFASGGYYSGGLALVGERGPELIDFNRPGYVYNAGQTQGILSGDSRIPALLESIVSRLDSIEQTNADAAIGQIAATRENTDAVDEVRRAINRKPSGTPVTA